MIGFRQHVVTLVALFLALAVGIVLGGGPLSEVGTAVTPARTAPATTAAPDARAAYADTFAGAVAPARTPAGWRTGTVALVVLPGADGAEVDALPPRWAPPAARSSDGTTSRTCCSTRARRPWSTPSAASWPSRPRTPRCRRTRPPTTGSARCSAVRSRPPRPTGTGLGADSTAIVESLAGAGLLTSARDRRPARRRWSSSCWGADPGPESDPILEGLLAGLDGTATGVVVAAEAGRPGRSARLRESASMAGVTSVDGTDGAAGQTTAVLALIRSLTTSGGAFGAAGADGAVPLG